MNKFVWGNIADPRYNVTHYVERTVGVMNIRNIFHRLAAQLMIENKNDKAIEVLDRCIEVIPDDKIPYDYGVLAIIEDYYKLEEFEKGNEIATQLLENYSQQVTYFNHFKGKQANLIERDIQIALFVVQNIYSISFQYQQTEISQLAEPILKANIGKMQFMNQ